MGINGRGGSHIDEFSKIKGVRVTALCDVDRDVPLAREGKFNRSTVSSTPGGRERHLEVVPRLGRPDDDRMSAWITSVNPPKIARNSRICSGSWLKSSL